MDIAQMIVDMAYHESDIPKDTSVARDPNEYHEPMDDTGGHGPDQQYWALVSQVALEIAEDSVKRKIAQRKKEWRKHQEENYVHVCPLRTCRQVFKQYQYRVSCFTIAQELI